MRDKNRQDHKNTLSEFLNPGDLAFDVGANIGERTDIMLSLGARVVAFEPQPALAREVGARADRSRLTVVHSAVGAEVGTADLHLTTSTGMASLRPDWSRTEERGFIKVPVTTLDRAIAQHGEPAFCKIDVEGFEVEVLKGLSTPLKGLSFEFHCHDDAIARARECIKLLTRLHRYQFNLVGSEEGKLLLPRWLDHDEFEATFPSCAFPHFYGDILARRCS